MVLNSGASHHMPPNFNSFKSINSLPCVSVMTTDGIPLPLAVVGSVCKPNLFLSDVYRIPNFSLNLISVGQLCDLGSSISFTSSSCSM